MTQATTKKADASTPTPPEAPAEASQTAGEPIVVKVGKKKKKRKYTRGLRDIQRLQRGFEQASERVGDGIAAGLSSVRKRSNQSSRKKRDGAIRDALENWSYGMGKALRRSSFAPYDVARRLGTRRLWRQGGRAVATVVTSPFSLFLR